MNKLFLLMLCPAFVLLSGVAGCTKEKNLDEYNPPDPVVIRNGETQDFKAWNNKNSERGLDLHDTFDFTAAGAASLEAVARCKTETGTILGNVKYTSPGKMRVFQIVPQEILNFNVGIDQVTCNFDVILTNGFGSKHIYIINDTPIGDSGFAEIEIADGLVRYAPLENGYAQIICRDVFFAPIVFRQVTEMKYFNTGDYTIRPSVKPETVVERALQSCRVATVEHGQATHLSSRFDLVVNHIAIDVSVAYFAPTGFAPESAGKFTFFGHGMKIADYLLNNMTEAVRRVKVNKAPQPMTIEMFGPPKKEFGKPAKLGPVQRAMVTRNILTFEATPNENATVEDGGSYWLLTLQPNASIAISMTAQSPTMQCGGVSLEGAFLYPSQPVVLEEVDPWLRKIQDIPMRFLGDVTISAQAQKLDEASRAAAEIVPHGCLLY